MNKPVKTQDACEKAAWKPIQGVWQALHGDFLEHGFSVQWHDFRLDHEMDWGESFQAGSLEICLNFSGAGVLQNGAVNREIGPNQLAIYAMQNGRLRATRNASSVHRFLTVGLSPAFLRAHLGNELDVLKVPIRRFVEGQAPAYLEVKPLTASLLALQFAVPPVAKAARKIWYLGRVLELLSQSVFIEEEPELSRQKHQRSNRERIDLARSLMECDIANPPSLRMLAQAVGCSMFHLSRMFAQESGMSIPKFLRIKRIERAAELLRTGSMNVTEAAMSVGYSSLSAFNRAFVEQIGCCPGLYPHARIPGRE